MQMDGLTDRQDKANSFFTILQVRLKLEQMKVNEEEEGTGKKEKEDVQYTQ